MFRAAIHVHVPLVVSHIGDLCSKKDGRSLLGIGFEPSSQKIFIVRIDVGFIAKVISKYFIETGNAV